MGCVQSSENKTPAAGAKEAETQQQVPDRTRRRLSVLKGADSQVEEGATKAQQQSAATKFETLLELLPAGDKRFSVAGLQPTGSQKGFEDKCKSVSSNYAGDQVNVAQFGLGYACKKGLKPESPNQDDYFVLQVDNSCGIYGVFDGHGPFGHEVSHFVHQLLPSILLRSADTLKSDPKEALTKAFTKTHQQAAKANEKQVLDCTLSGTTGTVLVLREEQNEGHIAHVGDSRAVIAELDESTGNLVGVELTPDHKPGLAAEKARIHKNGGQVRCLNGDVNERVFLKGKLYPGLAMSRSIGDLVGASAGVISDPELKSFTIEDKHQFVLICSDGVWEFISNQEVHKQRYSGYFFHHTRKSRKEFSFSHNVHNFFFLLLLLCDRQLSMDDINCSHPSENPYQAVDLVNKYDASQAMQAAEELAKEAWKRWIAEEQTVVDDITVILAHFQPSRAKSLLQNSAVSTAAAA
ncbi:unnamed protein product [Amoebophrya sp. A120]|nr:unnamed protein product [Amoebophrya sp. A120]|eukprot:GSA120T00021289001.1